MGIFNMGEVGPRIGGTKTTTKKPEVTSLLCVSPGGCTIPEEAQTRAGASSDWKSNHGCELHWSGMCVGVCHFSTCNFKLKALRQLMSCPFVYFGRWELPLKAKKECEQAVFCTQRDVCWMFFWGFFLKAMHFSVGADPKQANSFLAQSRCNLCFFYILFFFF